MRHACHFGITSSSLVHKNTIQVKEFTSDCIFWLKISRSHMWSCGECRCIHSINSSKAQLIRHKTCSHSQKVPHWPWIKQSLLGASLSNNANARWKGQAFVVWGRRHVSQDAARPLLHQISRCSCVRPPCNTVCVHESNGTWTAAAQGGACTALFQWNMKTSVQVKSTTNVVILHA